MASKYTVRKKRPNYCPNWAYWFLPHQQQMRVPVALYLCLKFLLLMFKNVSDSQGYITVVLIWVSLANDIEKFSNVYLPSYMSLEADKYPLLLC